MTAAPERERDRAQLRPLLILLIVQVVLGAVLLWLIASGTLSNWLTGDSGKAPAAVPASVVSPGPAAFSGERALAWARRQVALGPRPAGSAAQRRAAAFLVKALPHGHFEPIGATGLRNIVGEIPGRGRAILLIAHYDTTPVPGYLGANNSAAAVGAVLELARVLRADRVPGGRPVRFLLTDGEEAPTFPVTGDFTKEGLRGSRWAAAHDPLPGEAIVLDFVGQKGLRLPREEGSNPYLWSRLRQAARRAGVAGVFPSATRSVIFDDHTPFTARGVAAIDLIDFDYPCWQKRCDTLSQLSARSIGAAGEAVLGLVRELRRGR